MARPSLRSMPVLLGDAAQALGLLLGVAAVALAAARLVFGLSPAGVCERAVGVVGLVFPAAFIGLVWLAAIAALRLTRDPADGRWRQIGLQAASGIATLALTFTLLGISLGIGSLSDRPLTPSSVQGVIGELTAQFALAFVTTVIGLPVAAGLRALLLVLAARRPAVELR